MEKEKETEEILREIPKDNTDIPITDPNPYLPKEKPEQI